jgi:hypothetical protein
MGDRSNDKYDGAVRRCTRLFWPGKALEKTPRGVIQPVCEKTSRTPQEKNLVYFIHCQLLSNQVTSAADFNLPLT